MFLPPPPPQPDGGIYDYYADEQLEPADAFQEEYIESTQLQSQTQLQDGDASFADFSHLWGRLVAASPGLERLEFARTKNVYTIGRATKCDFRIAAPLVSALHCSIEYRRDGLDETFTINDNSSNGTFLNGRKIGKGNSALINNSDEISIGMPNDLEMEDYRFIFRTSDAPDPLLGGGLYDEYSLSKPLGKGAFATVRKGLHKQSRELVAVKIIAKSRFSSKSMELFSRERMIMSALEHPAIVKYKAFYEDEMSLFLVMEFVPGGELMTYIESHRGGPLAESEAKHLTRELCKGIQYSHSRGITHRDLKPENILLTTTEPKMPKIADFGLAKAVDSQTFLRTMCGTPAYLAPEVVISKDGYTQTVDSWSLGVIVFGMLTGKSPFTDEGALEVVEQVSKRSVMWEILYQCNVDKAAEDFLRGLIHKDPNVRMTMDDALQHEWLSGIPAPRRFLNAAYRDTTVFYDNTASSSFVSSHAPETPLTPPSLSPAALDDCSQDMGNLRLDATMNSVDMEPGSRFSADSDSMNIVGNFPSIPNMPYPEPSDSCASMTNGTNLAEISGLLSAWKPRHEAEGEETITITSSAKRKHSSPPVSEASSSPLSSPPPLSEDDEDEVSGNTALQTPSVSTRGKRRKIERPARNGARASARLRERREPSLPVTPDTAPPSATGRGKRRRVSGGGAPSSSKLAPARPTRRHSSDDLIAVTSPRRSTRNVRKGPRKSS